MYKEQLTRYDLRESYDTLAYTSHADQYREKPKSQQRSGPAPNTACHRRRCTVLLQLNRVFLPSLRRRVGHDLLHSLLAGMDPLRCCTRPKALRDRYR